MDFLSQFEKYNLPVLELGVKLPEFEITKDYKEKYNLKDNVSDYEFLLQNLESKLLQNHASLEYYLQKQKIYCIP